MRDYIILNGISSETIPGLLIQKLPPITKPKVRANIEEIDGRNGDIITPLGYSAYDKEILTGLYGDFDIDQIIKYFNSSGTVVFSNESDKYYNYSILDQIDFEKLLRFRQGTVKMHVQPFKYSRTENQKTFSIDNTTENIVIRNAGNIYSKPIITITGTGDVGITLNDNQIFQINLNNINEITIDTNTMDAYHESILLNRNVVGDYDNFKLNPGNNVITWTGSVTQIKIENFSRWI